ncbi:hypothetical protein K491DRAFT_678146 [Lophiostoma macrostomum CBS 122681]|uniref:Rhodopsin domain-containing protein n=1 Tax=Lophiostoma macrostomum CBS 122681 TaxID=1314788 RepID=A0A6A6T968_9PLEO|nr:hypothetical protein K491DRAFT_678146 [Lophiostoma macrostomum CBS 122681]
MDYSKLPPYDDSPARKYMIAHAGKIGKTAFRYCVTKSADGRDQAATITLFVIAIVCTLARFIVRATSRRKPSLDDWLVLLATASLIVTFTLLNLCFETLYILEATNDFAGTFVITQADIAAILTFNQYSNAFIPMFWLTIYSIKLAFLAFFHILIRQLEDWLRYYYWSAVLLTIACMFSNLTMSLATCPYVGKAAATAKCITNTNHHTSVSVNVASSVLDIVCDLLVISIPIIVLSKSTMRMKQKVGLMALLSLSVVMIAMTLTRVIGLLATTHSTNKSGSSPVWGFFWAFVEPCVAVIMASIIVIRSVFIKQSILEAQRHEVSLISQIRQRLLASLGFSPKSSQRVPSERASAHSGSDNAQISNVHVTRLSLGGLKAFIRGEKSKSQMDASSTMGDTHFDLDELEYHNVRRQEVRPTTASQPK